MTVIRGRAAQGVINYSLLAVAVVLFMFPMYWIIVSSLKTSPELFAVPPSLFPRTFTLRWYVEVFTQSRIPGYFLNSFIIAGVTTIASLALASLAAYSVTRFRYPGQPVVLLALLLTYVFPPILLFIPLYLILSQFGIIDTYLAGIVTHTTITLPFSVWLLRAFFQSVPKEIEESARIDGCSRLGVLFRVVLPLVIPGLFSTGIFSFILSWNEYLYASVVLPSEAVRTIPVGIAELVSQYDIRWGAMMSAATLTTIPVVIMFLLIQKHFVEGLTAGAVKE